MAQDNLLNFIDNYQDYTFFSDNIKVPKPKKTSADVIFYEVEEITFEDQSPRKEALENVLSSLRFPGGYGVYLLLGTSECVKFYYGISGNISADTELTNLAELGDRILKPSIEGNFKGSRIRKVSTEKTKRIVNEIERFKEACLLDGIPGILEDNEEFQSVDRLVEVMRGDSYAVIITSKKLSDKPIYTFEKQIYNVYDELLPKSKKSIQKGANSSTTQIDSYTEGENSSRTEGDSTQRTDNHGKTHQESRSVTENDFDDDGDIAGSKTENTSRTDNEGSYSNTSGKNSSKTQGSSKSKNIGKNITSGETKSENYEFADRQLQEWIKYIDETLLPRIDYAKGKGLFIATVSLYAKDDISLMKLSSTFTTLFSSSVGNRKAYRTIDLKGHAFERKLLENFQIPEGQYKTCISNNEKNVRTLLGQWSSEKELLLGNWLSVNELSAIAGLPQKEVVGLSLREEVDFGLNYFDEIPDENKIKIGNLVQNGNVLLSEVYFDSRELSKHIFVTGVTGSGKTTTCKNILCKSGMNYLIVEPAKTEYRELLKRDKDILVFTLGKDKVAPFRLNPFEFYPHESITSHVSMLMASIESAFEMEAAIPQIIEESIYECYKDCGWNINDDTNRFYQGDTAFSQGIFSFPTLTELMKKTEFVVESKGFDTRLKKDYIGSIKARLQGLMVGAKGLMLDTKRSIDFRDLVHKKVVLELEEIKSGSEKALIMGFVLSNLNEAIKEEYEKDHAFKHITLVEEAHRLLSKYEAGDLRTKKQAVEMFTDMLAEVRKYGESLIIVDQIPSKLTPEVLKNTNSKIVHKIFAQDDKDAIGNTMALSDDQKRYLSFLEKGRAIVFSQGWTTSLQVQINPPENDKDGIEIRVKEENGIRKNVLDYFCENYKSGVVPSIALLNHHPSREEMETYLKLQYSCLHELLNQYNAIFRNYMATNEFKKLLLNINEFYDDDHIALFIRNSVYYEDTENIKLLGIREIIEKIKNDNFDMSEYNKLLSYGRRL